MAQKDIAEKLLEEFNDVFADILNTLFFQKNLVQPDELEDAPTEFHYWVNDKKGCRELRRDVAKVYKIYYKSLICRKISAASLPATSALLRIIFQKQEKTQEILNHQNKKSIICKNFYIL